MNTRNGTNRRQYIIHKASVMKRILSALVSAALAAGTTAAQSPGNVSRPAQSDSSIVEYDTYFTPQRLRVDFILAGNKDSQQAYLADLRKECAWAGSHKSLIDPFRYGEYMFEAWDGDRLVYSRGFSALFLEWRTTAQAEEVSKAFAQSVWMPFPKKPVRIVLSERVKATGEFRQMFSCTVDPHDPLIRQEADSSIRAVPLLSSGGMEEKVDLLFVAEGYTAEQTDKFHADCRRLMDSLFTMEPYRSRKDDFNISVLDVISEESGTDVPNHGIWKDTAMGSHYFTFYIDRYLTLPDHTAIADKVSGVPFDALYIVVNDPGYGGGGIYNSYGMGTSDNPLAAKLFIHEFGHSFAGLGDEYSDDSVAYLQMYSLKTEPWEPNITTLVDFGSKWKDMAESGEYGEEAGLVEGAGYMPKGIYRPRADCRMRTNSSPDFCPVCRRAINRMIDYYCR